MMHTLICFDNLLLKSRKKWYQCTRTSSQKESSYSFGISLSHVKYSCIFQDVYHPMVQFKGNLIPARMLQLDNSQVNIISCVQHLNRHLLHSCLHQANCWACVPTNVALILDKLLINNQVLNKIKIAVRILSRHVISMR